VVEVVAKPHRHAEDGLEPECFPGPPERFEPGDSAGVAPPSEGTSGVRLRGCWRTWVRSSR
jgi:hypothetical protein